MNRTFRKRSVSKSPTCGFSKESPTKEGLAYTPSELMEYSQKGIPVSAASVETYFDGEANPSFELAADQLRGVDLVDVWLAQSDARSRLAKAHVNDTNLYG